MSALSKLFGVVPREVSSTDADAFPFLVSLVGAERHIAHSLVAVRKGNTSNDKYKDRLATPAFLRSARKHTERKDCTVGPPITTLCITVSEQLFFVVSGDIYMSSLLIHVMLTSF